MADEIEVPLGSLRWVVTLAKRVQAPSGTGIVETLTNPIQVHANIQSVGAIAFWGSMQVDTPVTHKITIRWQPYLDNTYVVVREQLQQDGSVRKETFRIRRIKELNGRKRFIEIEAELEKVG